MNSMQAAGKQVLASYEKEDLTIAVYGNAIRACCFVFTA